jgi:hypothetical protein
MMVAAGSCLAIGAASALAQPTVWTGATNENWFTPGNWSNGVPDATKDATLGGVLPFPNPTQVLIDGGVGHARNVTIPKVGGAGLGSTDLRIYGGGSLTVAQQTYSNGIIHLGDAAGNGTLDTGTLVVGDVDNGVVNVRRGSLLRVRGNAVFGRGNNAGNNGGRLDLDGLAVGTTARAVIDGDLILGQNAGSIGSMFLKDANVYANNIRLGVAAGGGGLNPGYGLGMISGDTTIRFTGNFDVGSQAGGQGNLVLSGSFNEIVGENADGTVNANALMRIYSSSDVNHFAQGAAQFDTRVQFLSKFQYGAGNNKAVTVTFDRDMLRRVDRFVLTPGLTRQNVRSQGAAAIPAIAGGTYLGMPPQNGGQLAKAAVPADTDAQADAKITLLTARALPNTVFNVQWGDNTAARDIQMTAANDAKAATISIPFDPAGVDPKIRGRMRLLQIGANQRLAFNAVPFVGTTTAGDKPGQIRNLTTAVTADDRVEGRTRNMNSDFDVMVLGKPVTPVHQDWRIANLHGRGLNGAGVVMGTTEGQFAFHDFGAFEDWTQNSGRRITFVDGANALDGSGRPRAPVAAPPLIGGNDVREVHPTIVNAIMIGYDPLGVHVDGQSRFENEGRRINGGFGFTGVANKATLIGGSLANSVGVQGNPNRRFTDFAIMANLGVKVLNSSHGQAGPVNGFLLASYDAWEIEADFWIREKGVIYTKSAGNQNNAQQSITSPGGAYNGIVVGNFQYNPDPFYPANYHVNHWGPALSTSFGPISGTSRAKPDLVAQGTGNYAPFMMEDTFWVTTSNPEPPPSTITRSKFLIDQAYPVTTNYGLYSTLTRIFESNQPATDRNNNPTMLGAVEPKEGTSFAAPTVAGVAALMVQRTRQLASGNPNFAIGEDPRVVKSILQTSTDKDLGRWGQGFTTTPLPSGSSTTTPLSYVWGAGFMNPMKAIDLLEAGRGGHGIGNVITGDGWNFARLNVNDNDDIGGLDGHVYFMQNVVDGSPFTATLNWYRRVTGKDAGGGPVTNTSNLSTITYSHQALFDMDFALYFWGNNVPIPGIYQNLVAPQVAPELVFRSQSFVDNVEHIFLPSLQGGNYLLRVYSPFTAAGQPFASEDYAVSWSFKAVPTPGTAGVLLMLGLVAARRRRSA